MPKERSDHLFTLIKSLRKSEKRYFKVKNKAQPNEDTKYLLLFDALDKMEDFNEELVIKKNDWINPRQFSNLKAHLYKKVLQSLKEYTASSNDEVHIREQIDYIQILFDRSLYQQSMQLLQKVKKAIKKSENLELQLEVLKWEKNLLPYSLSKNHLDTVRKIVSEANTINERISRVNQLTNLTAELNAIYVKTGYIRNKEDHDHIRNVFLNQLPEWNEDEFSFREKLLWYDIQLSYYSFIQNFEEVYRYARKWVDLFRDTPNSAYYLEMYIKALNQLLNAQARLSKYTEFQDTHRILRNLANHRLIQLNENLQIRLFKYSYAHQFNGYFMVGDFKKGVSLLQRIEERLEGYIGMLDKHSELVLFYKIACLYFGNENYRKALKWLNRIINSEDQDIREDVHSFARIINLITHYELGNRDVIDYYIRSTYRFLLKKDDLHAFQQYILEFLKGLSREITNDELIERFKRLREQLMELSESKYDKRAFVYFDIISWLESKIYHRPVGDVIREKALKKVS
ncbi:hypothetical protein [Marinoscillum furvescens]|uniref:Tetratricopeptide repeat protein n=1 Tax=Marinoscillum furvescens DSM 4134 TaxID=1122208 RepID=A0A3D9KZX7_MARFU|nr:hypothetical protein [Marinoscillum furvescens]RED92835.1 hypothetical protein C7460_12852 [Marinoscillum furvescens DSM 4134]